PALFRSIPSVSGSLETACVSGRSVRPNIWSWRRAMGIEVLAPGLLSSFQDLGRHGVQKLGIFVGGAMDEFSHRLANALVGNPPERATLEITLLGPMLLFREPARIAICGADLGPRLDGSPIALGVAHEVKAGSRLSFGQRAAGSRCYLAVA